MNQETINRTNSNTFNASFSQKSTGLSLIITISAALYFIARLWPMRATALVSDTLPAGYGGLVLTTLTLLIVAQIVLQTVLVIGAGSAGAATAVEQVAALKARRNAYYVLMVTILSVVASVFVTALTPFDTANLAIMGFALAEIVQMASQLFYGRQ